MLYQGGLRWVDTNPHRDVAGNINKRQSIITPILRLLFSLTSLVDTSEFFEVSIHLLNFPFCHFLVILSMHFFWSFFLRSMHFALPSSRYSLLIPVSSQEDFNYLILYCPFSSTIFGLYPEYFGNLLPLATQSIVLGNVY